jgi:hypothetical protein
MDDGLASLCQTLLKENNEANICILIIRLTQWVIKKNYMVFNNRKYLQINGTAIDTPLAVTYAGLFMADIETRALNKFKICKLPELILYKRLMDDFARIHINRASVDNLINTLQNILPEQI